MGKFEVALGSIVTSVWTATFFIPGLDPTQRVGAQAAMMVVLGAVFGFRVVRNGKNNKKES